MLKTLLIAGCALASVALSGCASASGGGTAILNDLQGCHRHYNGTLAPGNVMVPVVVTLAVEIDCPQGVTTGVLIPPAAPVKAPADAPAK